MKLILESSLKVHKATGGRQAGRPGQAKYGCFIIIDMKHSTFSFNININSIKDLLQYEDGTNYNNPSLNRIKKIDRQTDRQTDRWTSK